MTASKQQQTKPAMTNTDTDSLDKGFQNHFVLLGANVLADHLLVHLGVFLQERGHLHGIQWGGQQPLLLQERNPFGRLLVCAVVLLVSILGLLASFGIRKTDSSGSHLPFPWAGPIVSMQDSLNLRRDPLLLLAVMGDMFFYFFSLLTVMVINTLGISELHMSKTQTSLLAVSLMVGVCLGALIAARITSNERWSHVLGPACFGMGVCLLGTGVFAGIQMSFQWILLLITLMGAGLCGGVFLIPLTSFIQVRPEKSKKGKVIAASNFCAFSAMLIAGKLFTLFDGKFLPSRNMLYLGTTGVICAFLFYGGSVLAGRYDNSRNLEKKHV